MEHSLDVILAIFDRRKLKKYRKRQSYALKSLLKQFPQGLFKYWRRFSHEEFPNIARDALFFVFAAGGLMIYFKCVEVAEDMATLLPSKAADSVWHAWLSYDPKSLEDFCVKHFHRKINHTLQREFTRDPEQALVRTFVINSVLDGFDFRKGKVPSLFTLDTRLTMAHGLSYFNDFNNGGGSVLHVTEVTLERSGWSRREFSSKRQHPDLSFAGFVKHGYVNPDLSPEYGKESSAVDYSFIPMPKLKMHQGWNKGAHNLRGRSFAQGQGFLLMGREIGGGHPWTVRRHQAIAGPATVTGTTEQDAPACGCG